MADNIKIIGNISDPLRVSRIDVNDQNILNPQTLQQSFGYKEDYIEIFVYSSTNELLYIDDNYKNYKSSPNYGLTDGNIPVIEIDPITDLKLINFISGNFKVQYNFFKPTLLNQDNDLFIQQISDDRTELRINSATISSEDLVSKGQSLIDDLLNSSSQKYFLLNQDNNYQNLIINIAIDTNSSTPTILLKLYNPLPLNVRVKSGLWVTEEITEPYVFDISLDTSVIPQAPPKLKGPNFDIEIDIKQNVSTKYENYNSLISLLTGSSYNKAVNYANNKSYDLNIDYTLFDNFIHFSSAKKRLEIFYYKAKQIENYNNNINILTGSATILKNEETASIKVKIDNIVSNFDGFENYMYYESSSYAWPKQGSNKPYSLLSTGSSAVISWYDNYIDSATDYDNNNLDYLYYTIPNYVKNDPDNYQSYYDFIDMIGHYFDNVWIYITSINELYNADNNLEKGVSKDIVYDALKSLGVKLYNSKGDDQFDDYIGGFNSGSNIFIDDFSVTSSYLNNIPKKDILSELYKRIYHNIPLLSKTKGTATGLQSLITSFGVTSSIFSPKEFGGSTKYNQLKGYDNDKITIQNNTITGSVLSPFISVQQPFTSSEDFTSTDLHFVDLSFSPQNQLNSRISSSISSVYPTFSLDEYIGDPRLMESLSYDALIDQYQYFVSSSSAISGSANKLDYKGFFELVKYFDNSLFKMLKDFVPARTNALTGITIKSPVLERNKIQINKPKVNEEHIYEAEYAAPIISEDADYHYDKIGGDKSSFYTGELTGSNADINEVFENSNPNPYLFPTNSIDINLFNHSDFNVTLNNISSSVVSSTRRKIENLYNKFTLISDSLSSEAELQDSYENLLGHKRSRYEGTKLYSLKYNSYTSASGNYVGDSSYGKTAAIDNYTRKIGLFTQIKESPFFVSPRRNNVALSYLVDENGGLTELNRRNENWVELQNIFKSGDNLDVSLFDNQKFSNQKISEGSKLIYNSGYNYLPALYFTGSESSGKVFFDYSSEALSKLFESRLISNGFISGSANNQYPLKASGSTGHVIYNIFDQILSNDNNLFANGTVGVDASTSTYPSYSVSTNGTYVFLSEFDINLQFQSTDQQAVFRYDVISGSLVNFHPDPRNDKILLSETKVFNTSNTVGLLTRGFNLISNGAEIVNITGPESITSDKFTLYIGNNDLILTYINDTSFSGPSATTWYAYIVQWKPDPINSPFYIITSLVFSEGISFTGFSSTDYITTTNSVSGIQSLLSGILSFNTQTPEVDLQKGNDIYFRLSLESSTTSNFTSSFVNAGSLRNSLTSNISGNSVFAVGTSGNQLISSSIPSTSGSNHDTFIMNESLSDFTNYFFLANSGSTQHQQLYNKFGDVNDPFNPTTNDILVIGWDGQSTEFVITNVYTLNKQKHIVVNKPIPLSLESKLHEVAKKTNPTGVDSFLLLKVSKDENNLILRYNKPAGPTSLGFVIPENLHPDVLKNIDTITREVKTKLVDSGFSTGSI
jgi:hypothetical protein